VTINSQFTIMIHIVKLSLNLLLQQTIYSWHNNTDTITTVCHKLIAFKYVFNQTSMQRQSDKLVCFIFPLLH